MHILRGVRPGRRFPSPLTVSSTLTALQIPVTRFLQG